VVNPVPGIDERFMRMALEEAGKAAEEGEVPVGAVLVVEGRVVARAHNRREAVQDPTAHAELLALRRGAAEAGSWRLSGATLYSTKEPCVMCAGTMINARLGRLVYGCSDEKGGAVSIYGMLADGKLNHVVEVTGGVLEGECAGVLRDFFSRKRRGGRVDEGGGLENRCGGNSTVGSNPTPSARIKKK
jgi:tRNA(adenine34) deaminase